MAVAGRETPPVEVTAPTDSVVRVFLIIYFFLCVF